MGRWRARGWSIGLTAYRFCQGRVAQPYGPAGLDLRAAHMGSPFLLWLCSFMIGSGSKVAESCEIASIIVIIGSDVPEACRFW